MSEEDPVASARNKDIENTNNYTIFLILDLYFPMCLWKFILL